MNLGSLLVPILGGYWLLTHLYFTRSDALRDSGYHLFFRSSIAGLVLAAAAHLLIRALDAGFPGTSELWKPYLPSEYQETAILSVVLGFILPFVLNRFYSRERAERRTVNARGDLVELLITESLVRGKLIELSLRSGKSYIGFALRNRMTRRWESEVAIIPIASGYRDKDTQELRIVTDYSPVLNESAEDEPGSFDAINEDFRIVLPRAEIISARIFLPQAYQRFQWDAGAPQESPS